jgi:hypothetical protein
MSPRRTCGTSTYLCSARRCNSTRPGDSEVRRASVPAVEQKKRGESKSASGRVRRARAQDASTDTYRASSCRHKPTQ